MKLATHDRWRVSGIIRTRDASPAARPPEEPEDEEDDEWPEEARQRVEQMAAQFLREFAAEHNPLARQNEANRDFWRRQGWGQ